MKNSNFELKLEKKIKEAIPGACPGVVVQAFQNGRKVCDIAVGDTYAYYDLASLTKIIFTTQAMMLAFNEGKWNLKSKLVEFLPWFPFKEMSVLQLLNHSSGLKWWAPFYKDLDLSLSIPEKWESLKQMLIKIPLEKSDKSVYSDVGFMVLSYLLQEFYQKNLFSIWTDIKENFYPRSSIDFHLNNEILQPQKLYAPTERCAWRNRVLQGEVHDENAWALGGVSTHAGLFGSIDDIGWYGLLIRAQLGGISKTLIKQKTAQTFATRSMPAGNGDFAIGYMMPTSGHSSSGDYFSIKSIGHTGFTGTSFWFDPVQDLIVVILSNRVAFGRDKEDFKLLRPKIHNWIVEGLKRS
jgi:CubicO group peptidase (beta-lactamase class C family)